MKKIWVIARKDMLEAFRSKSTYIYIVVLFAFCFPYYEAINSVIRNLSRTGSSSRDIIAAVRLLINVATATMPLMLSMLVCGVFSAYAVIMDKTKRIFESLLSTPVSLAQVWLGKSLAVFVPGMAISIVITLLLIILLNFLAIMPALGTFILPDFVTVLIGFVDVPVMVFLVISIICMFQLITSNPRIPNIAFSFIFMAIYFTTITQLDTSWNFSLIYLMITLVLAGANWLCSRFLTKERVILSNKS